MKVAWIAAALALVVAATVGCDGGGSSSVAPKSGNTNMEAAPSAGGQGGAGKMATAPEPGLNPDFQGGAAPK